MRKPPPILKTAFTPETDRITRRHLLKHALIMGGSVGIAAALPPSVHGAERETDLKKDTIMSKGKSSCFAYVGCRTTKERNAHGEGISVYHVDNATSKWTLVQLVKDLVNPSFLTFDRQRKHLYTVHGDNSEVSAFRIDPQTARLDFINRQSTKGSNPAHLSVDATNKFLVVANYATGTVVTLPIGSDGALGEVRDLTALPGEPGPHRIEQKSSHPHQVAYDLNRRFIVVPDKGLDKIFVFKLDAESGRLIPNDPPWVEVPEGAGPRHIDFHPGKDIAYVVNELNSTVTTYAWDPVRGTLKPLQVLPATPSDYIGNNRASEIAISTSGRHIYVSNRGHDSIGLFSVDGVSGLLSPEEWTRSQGKGPRFFTFEPEGLHLYAANELTDSIVQFGVDKKTGKLSPTGQITDTGSPVCIVFADL
jgi:6-phosphogluconolactonase (cycloisomerase 2 family)